MAKLGGILLSPRCRRDFEQDDAGQTLTLASPQAPTKLNFDLAAERAAIRYQREQAQARLLHEQHQGQLLAEQEHQRQQHAEHDAGGAGEQTFMTNDEDQSFVSHHPGHAEGMRGGTRGRGSAGVRGGRGGATGTRGGKAPALTKKRKEEMAVSRTVSEPSPHAPRRFSQSY